MFFEDETIKDFEKGNKPKSNPVGPTNVDQDIPLVNDDHGGEEQDDLDGDE